VIYGIAGITRSEMEIISEIALRGWNTYLRSRDPMIDRWGMPVVD
jgi:hypothetical protein